MIYVSLPYTITIFNCIIDIYIIKLALLSCALIELQTDRVAMLIFEISVIVERMEPKNWNRRIKAVSDISPPLPSSYSYLHDTYKRLILFYIFIVSLIKARLYRCKSNFVANRSCEKLWILVIQICFPNNSVTKCILYSLYIKNEIC